jgi:hypothetical protein
MIYVKVQYDAYNRSFKLVESSVGSLLEDYALYDLAIPFEDADQREAFTSAEPVMAHA